MSYMKPVTAEQVKEFLELNPGMGEFLAKDYLKKQNALEALECLRWSAKPEYSIFDHTIVDVLQYLVERE